MKTKVIITKDVLQHMLENNDQQKVIDVIGHALVALFKKQTEAEKSSNTTMIHNNVGFTGADGKSGAITAKYYLKHKTLLPWQVQKWCRKNEQGYARIAKYHAQLNQAAIEKAERLAAQQSN